MKEPKVSPKPTFLGHKMKCGDKMKVVVNQSKAIAEGLKDYYEDSIEIAKIRKIAESHNAIIRRDIAIAELASSMREASDYDLITIICQELPGTVMREAASEELDRREQQLDDFWYDDFYGDDDEDL